MLRFTAFSHSSRKDVFSVVRGVKRNLKTWSHLSPSHVFSLSGLFCNYIECKTFVPTFSQEIVQIWAICRFFQWCHFKYLLTSCLILKKQKVTRRCSHNKCKSVFSFHCLSTYYGLSAFGPLKDSWLKVNTLCEKCHTKKLLIDPFRPLSEYLNVSHHKLDCRDPFDGTFYCGEPHWEPH